MAYIINTNPAQKLIPKMVSMTDYEVYLNQVRSAIEPIRFAASGLSYFPPQLGGLSGQSAIIAGNVVLQMIDFEIP